MPVYGQFETVTELGRNGPYSAYRARTADGGWDLTFGELGSDANYVIKVLHADALDDPDALADEKRRFLDRVRSQRRVADAGATHWAPILDAGALPGDDGDAYCVSQFYPHTVASFAAAHNADAPTLYAVVAGTLDGLLELRGAQARPHGNLRLTNVLIDGPAPDAPLTPEDVRLTDPALEQDATIAGEVEDLYNVGEIIHALVLGQRFAGQHTLPVPPSDAWAALGKRGGDWLALCNELLSPRTNAKLRLHDVAARVAGMATSRRLRHGRRPRRSRKAWAVAAAALAVVAGLGAAEYVHYTRAWRELCAAHGSWLGPLSARLAQETPREFAADPYLNERVVAPLADARKRGIELNPRAIAGSDRPMDALAQRPPMNLGAVWDTERAWRVASKVGQSLAPDRWAAATELNRRRADYERRGWTCLVAYATVAAALADDRPDRDWVSVAVGVVDANARLARLDAARDAARTRVDTMVASAAANPALREKIGEFEANLRQSTDADANAWTPDAVDALTRQLTDADRVAAQFDALIPDLADAAKLQRVYEVRGWHAPARYLDALVDRAKPAADLSPLPPALAADRKAWEQVERTWKQIEDRRRVLETSGDRILATYREFLASAKLGEQPNLAALAARLDQVNDDRAWAAAAAKVSQDEWAKIDIVDFAQKSQVHRNFVGRTVATHDDLAKWLAEVERRGSQLASATYNPDGPVLGPDRPPVESLPKSPTTVATQSPTPTLAPPPPATQKAPVVVADAKPDHLPATRKAPDAVAAGPAPATQKTATTLASAGTSRPTYASAVTPTPPPVSVPRETTRPTTVAVKPPAPPPPDPEQVRREQERRRFEQEVRAFVTECRETGIGSKNVQVHPDIKAAWTRKNTQIADAVEKNPRLYTPQLRAERTKLRNRLLQLDGGFRDVSEPLALRPGKGPWNAALVTALAAAKPTWADALKNLTDLALRGEDKFDAGFDYLVKADQEWRASANRFLADANRADELLADGYVPDDRTTLNSSLASALKSVRTSELYQADPVRAALKPLLQPLADVERETTARTLRAYAARADLPLGVRLLAWAKTAGDVSTKALEEDVKNAQYLLGSAQSRLRDRGRVDSVKTRLEADLRSRWMAVLDTALRPEEIDGAIAMRDKITGIDPDQLPPRARLNFALHDLRQAVASAKGDDAAAQLAPLAKRFRDAYAALDPAQQKVPAVATAMAEVNRLGQGGQAAPVDFRQLGPMSEAANRGIRWNVAADDTGDRVTYTGTPLTDGGGGARTEELVLVFRRVRPTPDGRSSWLCTTETSLGVFADLVTAAGKWPDVRSARLLTDFDGARRDPRPGPRVWEWSRIGRLQDITWTRMWLAAPDFIPRGVADHYPPEIAADFNHTQIGNPRTRERAVELNPSRRMPMQYLSARAAHFAAGLAGCRLPTVGEWQAASRTAEQAVRRNVRDHTWRLELEHLAQRTGGRVRPDAGMFVPAGERASNEVWHQGGRELNDGVLWFQEVAAGSTPPNVFLDLVGNVGEYVTGGEAGKVYVIGASAVSPPGREPGRAFEVGADQDAGGFCDVGFRLAFSEPPVGVERLRDAVAGDWYLTAR